jgi:hypothetical protein
MSRSLTAALVLAALAACAVAAAAPPRVVRLAALPETLVVGQRWTARLTGRHAGRRGVGRQTVGSGSGTGPRRGPVCRDTPAPRTG